MVGRNVWVWLNSGETHAVLRRVPQVRAPDGELVDYELFTVKSMEDVLLREWEIDPTDVRLMEKIGEGEFGQVFRVCASNTRTLTLVTMRSIGLLDVAQAKRLSCRLHGIACMFGHVCCYF